MRLKKNLLQQTQKSQHPNKALFLHVRQQQLTAKILQNIDIILIFNIIRISDYVSQFCFGYPSVYFYNHLISSTWSMMGTRNIQGAYIPAKKERRNIKSKKRMTDKMARFTSSLDGVVPSTEVYLTCIKWFTTHQFPLVGLVWGSRKSFQNVTLGRMTVWLDIHKKWYSGL